MTFATSFFGFLRRPPAEPAEDLFGRRLGRIGERRENLVPRFLIFRTLASRRAA
jgi:hypothetical protein